MKVQIGKACKKIRAFTEKDWQKGRKRTTFNRDVTPDNSSARFVLHCDPEVN